MSVNITVNGKYMKTCKRHDLLDDLERVRKQNENERRKLRIQQVRSMSKNIAQKVRNDVEFEKEKQLKKIEEIRAQEIELWRQNTLAQQQKDFRSAIFQVGTAHRAARAENEQQIDKKKRKKIRKPLKQSKALSISSLQQKNKENVFKNANVQTDITGKCYPKPNSKTLSTESRKKKVYPVKIVNSDSEQECLEENSTTLTSELSSDESSSMSMSDSVEPSKTECSKKADNSKVFRAPSGKVGGEQETQINLITSPNSTNQRQENARVPEIINVSPNKKETHAKSKRYSSSPSKTFKPRKRFTQISDIIRMQKSSDDTEPLPRWSQPSVSRFQKSPQYTKSPVALVNDSRPTTTPKSPVPVRPISSQTTATLATKSSCSGQSVRSSGTRVQFYDYKNKFHKQYEQPTTVEHHKASITGTHLNAMEEAHLSEKLKEAREVETDKLRQKSAERCQKAIEREQVRRACEDLTAKLDALSKQRPAIPSDNHMFSSLRLSQIAKEKENKLNNAVEEILKRPAIITCPIINQAHDESKHVQKSNTDDLNIGSPLTNNEQNSLNSSDSCCSILLGYVNGQSKKIVDDIKKYNSQKGETDKAKAEKLQNLLGRINRLRDNLMTELEKCSAETDKKRVQNMMDSINEFRKEHESILIDGKIVDSISKREVDLRKKEAILEKKLKEFYELQKETKKKNGDEDSENKFKNKRKEKTDNNELETNRTGVKEKDNEIRTKSQDKENKLSRGNKDLSGRGDSQKINKKNEAKELLRNQEELLSSEGESKEEVIERRKLLVGEKPLEIVIHVRGDTKSKKTKKLNFKSPRILSSLIQSPTPKKIRNKPSLVRSIDSSSTSYRSLPSKVHNDLETFLTNVPSKSNKKKVLQNSKKDKSEQEVESIKHKGSTLNPLMAHYVQRLLGMSRTSINALGVSSSEIETPSSSIINTTANLSVVESEKLISHRLESVQKFIEDNYSFVEELEESLRQSNSSDSSLKTFEAIWKKTLKDQNKKSDKSLPKINDKPIKPVLKKTLPQKLSQKKDKQTQIKSQIDKSTQMTDNCTQRIAELQAMINKVRQEKQKILETTLSSVSENEKTEYLDLPERRNYSDGTTSKNFDSQLVKSAENLTQSPEATVPLEKNKPTAMSRDSGISISRPVTVQETRESPFEESHQIQSSTESISGQLKKPKPPLSISRYSPQLVEDIPHELSTIFEVDTPATSRVNTSIHPNNGQEMPTPINDKTEKITYRKFPSFEDYARINQLNMSQFDPEFSHQIEKEFNEFINHAKEGKAVDYEEFTSFSKYLAKSSSSENKEAAEELLASLKLVNLSFKRFPTKKQYLDKIGISNSDLLDSQSLENIDESKNLISNSSSTESILNIEKELKSRNILRKSFEQNEQSPDKGSSSLTNSSLIFKNNNEISGIRELVGTATSTDEFSGNLENDLKKIGIKWPSIMKKKTMETQALSSSTSSNHDQPMFTPRRKSSKQIQPMDTNFHKGNPPQDTTIQTEDGGRQLNLREFLTKELLKRTTTSTSFSFSDDSVTSSILRSIIGTITPSPQLHANGGSATLDRHKTSTPMASHSTQSVKNNSRSKGGASSLQLFSGESRLSSVHFNNSSKDVNKTAEKDVTDKSI